VLCKRDDLCPYFCLNSSSLNSLTLHTTRDGVVEAFDWMSAENFSFHLSTRWCQSKRNITVSVSAPSSLASPGRSPARSGQLDGISTSSQSFKYRRCNYRVTTPHPGGGPHEYGNELRPLKNGRLLPIQLPPTLLVSGLAYSRGNPALGSGHSR